MFSGRASGSDVASGLLEAERYPDVARQVGQFRTSMVATTLRQSLSASFQSLGEQCYMMLNDQTFFSPTNDGVYQPFEIRNIVDRVGGGDSFAAGRFLLSDQYHRFPNLHLELAAP